MRKLVAVLAITLLASSWCFSAENEKQTASPASKQTATKGNGGKDKIGGWIGYPVLGLSYSHEFNDLVQLDLLAGGTVGFFSNNVTFQAGTLFTLWEPVIKGQKCPLSLGPALGIDYTTPGIIKDEGPGFSVLLPLRWEVNFGNIPNFNLFLDWSPIGYSFLSLRNNATGKTTIHHTFITRFGVGLRYRIPSRK
ncbi:MAG: hypothetical protein ACTTKL_10400 [Treponema sp.]